MREAATYTLILGPDVAGYLAALIGLLIDTRVRNPWVIKVSLGLSLAATLDIARKIPEIEAADAMFAQQRAAIDAGYQACLKGHCP